MKRFLLSLFLLFFLFSPFLFSQRDWGQSGSIRIRWSDATTEFRDSVRAAISDSVRAMVFDSLEAIVVDDTTTLSNTGGKVAVDTLGTNKWWMLPDMDEQLRGQKELALTAVYNTTGYPSAKPTEVHMQLLLNWGKRYNAETILDTSCVINDTVNVPTVWRMKAKPGAKISRGPSFTGSAFVATSAITDLSWENIYFDFGEGDTTASYDRFINFSGVRVSQAKIRNCVFDSVLTEVYILGNTANTNFHAVVENNEFYSTYYRIHGDNVPYGGAVSPSLRFGNFENINYDYNYHWGFSTKFEISGVDARGLRVTGSEWYYSSQTPVFVRTGSTGSGTEIVFDKIRIENCREKGNLKGSLNVGSSYNLPSTATYEVKILNSTFKANDALIYLGGESGDGVVYNAIIDNCFLLGADSSHWGIIVPNANNLSITNSTFSHIDGIAANITANRLNMQNNKFIENNRLSRLGSEYAVPNNEGELSQLYIVSANSGQISGNLFSGGGSDTLAGIADDSTFNRNAQLYFNESGLTDSLIVRDNIFRNGQYYDYAISFEWSSGDGGPNQGYMVLYDNNILSDDYRSDWLWMPTSLPQGAESIGSWYIGENNIPERYARNIDAGNITFNYDKQRNYIYVSDANESSMGVFFRDSTYFRNHWFVEKNHLNAMTVNVNADDKLVGSTLGTNHVYYDPGLYEFKFLTDSTFIVNFSSTVHGLTTLSYLKALDSLQVGTSGTPLWKFVKEDGVGYWISAADTFVIDSVRSK